MTADTAAVPDRIAVPPPETKAERAERLQSGGAVATDWEPTYRVPPGRPVSSAAFGRPPVAAAEAPVGATPVEATLLAEVRQLREAAAERARNWKIVALTALLLAIVAAIAVPSAVHVHRQHEAKNLQVECLTDAMTADSSGLSTFEFNLEYPKCAIN